MVKRRRTQAFIDYATLIIIISIALLAMSKYIFHAIEKRKSHIWADLYDPQNGVR